MSLLKAQLALAALAELRAEEREQAANLLSELARVWKPGRSGVEHGTKAHQYDRRLSLA